MAPSITIRQSIRSTLFLALFLNIAGCGQLISNAKKDFANDLASTILESNDPETIKQGVPAYLILISSMIKGDPDNADLLESGAKLYGAYASSFTDDKESKQALASTAFNYAERAMCIRDEVFCDVKSKSYFEYELLLNEIDQTQAGHLFVFASSWAGFIEATSSDWNSVAELPRVKASIQRVIDLDEMVDNGNAHLYMAVLETLLPPSVGGKPELAKIHFERAIEISDNTNLMAKVLYAEKYARLLFDRELHDTLLNQVLAAGKGPKDQTLVNTLARHKARQLLDSADDYF